MSRDTVVKIETRTATLAKIALGLAFVALAASLVINGLDSSGNKLETKARNAFSGRAECSCFQSAVEECCNCTWTNGQRSSACEWLK